MNKAGFAVVVGVLVMMVAPGSARAALITTYTDYATFISATGATSATGALPVPPPASYTAGPYGSNPELDLLHLGSVLFDAPRYFVTDWTTVMPGAEIAISQGAGTVGGLVNDGINAIFDDPVDAAGFYFFEANSPGGTSHEFPNNCNKTACTDSTFIVNVMNGATLLETLAMNTPGGSLLFFGLSSDTPFTSLQIRETVGTDDNEYYGEFFTHRAANNEPTPVPEPGTLSLFGLSLAGVLLLRRRARGRIQTATV